MVGSCNSWCGVEVFQPIADVLALFVEKSPPD